eukprot:TRINITY_DN3402_c0_g1_i16.p1 TRINITY_DN3402_c0_g1~~TRINITY_DN3402_c0_g1_i16.p1  ORF type:complete len:240 (+),score=45.69 TRINITY_DN3402_c0_g1_i16:457-1176(+)
MMALIVSKQPPTKLYSYGFERFELLMAFSCACIMLFTGLYMLFEGVEFLLEGITGNVKVVPVMVMSFIGCIVHLCSMLFYRDSISIRSESLVQSSDRFDLQKLLQQHLLNIGASFSVFLSSWVVLTTGWNWVDPLVSCLNACFLLHKAFPGAIASGRVLLQSIPVSIKSIIEQNLRDALTVDGVLEIYKTHFWTNSPGVFVGSFIVRVRADADEQVVLKNVSCIFSPYVKYLSIQVEKW